MSRKLVHSFGHFAEISYFRHLAVGLHHLTLIEKLRLSSPRTERKTMTLVTSRKSNQMREVTNVVVFSSLREVTKTEVFLLARGDESSSFARGDQVRGTIFETFLALLTRRSRVGQNDFHH